MTILLFGLALVAALLSNSAPSWAAQAAVALLAAGSGVLIGRARSWCLPVASLWIFGAALFGFLQILAGISAAPLATVRESALLGTLALVFASGTCLFESTAERQRFLQLFAAAAGLIAAFAIMQPYAAHFGASHLAASADESVGPFPSRNAYASFVLLAFPVAVWAAHRLGTEWWLPAGTLLASAFMTGSRAGAILTLAEAAFLSAWIRSRRLLIALGCVAMAGFLWGGDNLRTRIGYRDPLEHRREIYASSLELISARPLAGWGLGTFEQVYPEQARFDVGALVNHAHNDWLESAVEGGLAYAAALTGCALLILWHARHSIWALGLPLTLLHSFVDFPFQRIGISVWFLLLAAAAHAHSESSRNGRSANSD